MDHGLFIAFEGIDGCGKSSLARLVASYLERKGFDVHITAEPSTGEIGKLIRRNLKNHAVPPQVDALLFAADRIEHSVIEILPELQNNKIVITDRYRDSSYVYQSIQGEKAGITLAWMQEINKFSLQPDCIFLLDIDAQQSLARRTQQNAQMDQETEKFEHLAFQEAIRIKFLEIARANSTDTYIVLDATQSLVHLAEIVVQHIINLIPNAT